MGQRLLPARTVHVWRWHLEAPEDRLRRLASFLSPDERERADRFRFQRHRLAFIAARGTLRELLSEYLDCAPEQVTFSYSAYGKPAVDQPRGDLRFNLSHSRNIALAALTRDVDLGVDVEENDRDVDLSIASAYFSPTEVERLRLLPAGEQAEAFLRIWTRKEAFVKAQGKGLSLPLHDFDVTVEGNSAPELIHCGWNPSAPAEWSLADLSQEGKYLAALAIPLREFELVSFCR